ncbi:MAG: 4-hydroxyphenylpyruvate dioxygenase [Euryarchaeota archaeon]|nr:4-hydroxyphenylpyruvate dioxygenase [Euryarchaeota archaeon]
MASPKNLGITGYDSAHFYVHDLDRARDFYVNKMDFAVLGRSSPELEKETGVRTEVYGARNIRFAVSASLRKGSAVDHYLQRHPEGAKRIAMRVKDLDHAIEKLDARKACFTHDPVEERLSGGTYKEINITGPLGDVDYTFIERGGNVDQWAPGMDVVVGEGGENRFGLAAMDHVTSNIRSMMAAVLFYRDVLGFEHFWDIDFHTQDSKPDATTGSGLRSIVMADPDSLVKFATNEPKKPHFTDSQIQVFVDDNHGAGVQHIALATPDIVQTVGGLRQRDVRFLDAPDTYYGMLPERMAGRGVTNIQEDIEVLEENRILVDGRDERYLLQIFMKENAELFGDKQAGPFFHEVIQRRGDNGFGEGNFRALFESIEKDQTKRLSKAEIERMVTVD